MFASAKRAGLWVRRNGRNRGPVGLRLGRFFASGFVVVTARLQLVRHTAAARLRDDGRRGTRRGSRLRALRTESAGGRLSAGLAVMTTGGLASSRSAKRSTGCETDSVGVESSVAPTAAVYGAAGAAG